MQQKTDFFKLNVHQKSKFSNQFYEKSISFGQICDKKQIFKWALRQKANLFKSNFRQKVNCEINFATKRKSLGQI